MVTLLHPFTPLWDSSKQTSSKQTSSQRTSSARKSSQQNSNTIQHQQVQHDRHAMPFPQVAEQREGRLGGGTHEGAIAYEAAEVVREDPRVSSVLERLTQVESRVGSQLDHLVKLQQQQVPNLPVCLVSTCVCLSVIGQSTCQAA